MKQPLQLKIDEPCHENWNLMTAQTQGRFCGSCQKTVIDFTSMSDSQLLEHFKNYNGNACGRFENHQLDRMLVAPPPAKPSWYKWGFAMLFSGFLFSNKAKAQGLIKLVKNDIKQQPVAQKKGEVSIAAPQKTSVLRGKVVDKSGAGVPYASVQVVGANWGTSTDSIGNFTLLFKDGKTEKLLSFSSIGFLAQTRLVASADNKSDSLTILMEKSAGELEDVKVIGYSSEFRTTIAGGIGVHTKVIKEIPLLQRLVNANYGLKVYPNPATAGSVANVQLSKKGSFNFRLVDLAGRVIFSQSKVALLGGQFFTLPLPKLAPAGQYIVQVTDSNGKLLATEKIMIVR